MSDRVRPETYLNASSLGYPDPKTIRRMIEHLTLESEIGPFRARTLVEDQVSSVRHSAARLLSTHVDRIGFAATTFSAWLPIVTRLSMTGKRLLIAPHEWGDNIRALEPLAKASGATLEILPHLDLATPDLDAWQDRIDETVAAIFVPLVTSVAGHRYPVERIGQLQRPDETMLIVDAAQAVGQIPVAAEDLNCNALVATTRKWLRGPRQTALFWLDRFIVDGRAIEPAELEPFDTNVASRLGLGTALEAALERTIKSIQADVAQLSQLARKRADEQGLSVLSRIPSATGAVSLALPAEKCDAVRTVLSDSGCVVKWPVPDVDEPYGRDAVPGHEILRITPHVYNSSDDIDLVFDGLARAPKNV